MIPVSGSTTRWAVQPSGRRERVVCACRASVSAVEITRRCQMVCVKPKPSFRSITDSWLLTRHTLLG